MNDRTLEASIQRASVLVATADRIAVLTGAGISTDSGIPDFRGPSGVWTKNPEAEKASHIEHYVSDPEVRKRNWELRASGALWPDVAPNLGHRSLVYLQERQVLHTLVTQNVDGLHEMAGIPASRIVEIHGTTRKARCLSCEWLDNIETVLDRVRAGEQDPLCECGGLLKSATVSFGQSLAPEDVDRMEVAANECDLLLAIGTTLTVYQVAQMVPLVNDRKVPIVIVNGQETAMDELATVLVIGSISKVLPRVVGWMEN